MYSVIIPTMWKSHRTVNLIEDLTNCDYIDEIILIDNNANEAKEFNTKKVLRFIPKENIFVNPSWNKGIQLAKNDLICICNDDINFNTDIFQLMSNTDGGIIGMGFENYSLKKDSNYVVKEVNSRPHGWGCLMFLNKKNYVNIPEQMKIACGDDWLFKYVQPSMALYGLSVQTEMSTTSSKENFYLQSEKDLHLFKILTTFN